MCAMLTNGIRIVFAVLLAILHAGCSDSTPKKPVADLITDLKNKDEAVRIKAARDIAGQANARDAIPALTEALKDSSPYVRKVAAATLGTLGPEASSSIPALEKARKDPDEGVRLAAVESLKQLQGK
jgi:HEAT repeat protein